MIVSGRSFAARLKRAGVRCVPIAEAQVTSFNVSYGEIGPSIPMIQQRPVWLVTGVISAKQSKPAVNIWDRGLARRD
jgi:hypothetical protein